MCHAVEPDVVRHAITDFGDRDGGVGATAAKELRLTRELLVPGDVVSQGFRLTAAGRVCGNRGFLIDRLSFEVADVKLFDCDTDQRDAMTIARPTSA